MSCELKRGPDPEKLRQDQRARALKLCREVLEGIHREDRALVIAGLRAWNTTPSFGDARRDLAEDVRSSRTPRRGGAE